MKFDFFTTTIATAGILAAFCGQETNANYAKQGVFLLSNQPDNEVGVYESLESGELVYIGRFATNGTGYPDPNDEENVDDLGSSNAIHYHVWDSRQWLVATNAGGPEGNSSLSIFEIQPDLQLELRDNVQLEGIFPCTTSASRNLVCAAACGGNVMLECFNINQDGTLEPEYTFDFQQELPIPEGRPNSVRASFGPGNILFSPNGRNVGLLMKGVARIAFEIENGLTNETLPNGINNSSAGLYVFPISEDEEGASVFENEEPFFLELEDQDTPFAFAWRNGTNPAKDQIAMVINEAGESGNFPICDEPGEEGCFSAITTILVTADDELDSDRQLSFVEQNVPLDVVGGCWITYRGNHSYTGNFRSNSISVSLVENTGRVEVLRTVPVGSGSIVNDVETTGPKLDGSVFLYSENQGDNMEIGVHRVIDGEFLQVLPGAPIPSGVNGWFGNNGLAATSISQAALDALYSNSPAPSPSPCDEMSTTIIQVISTQINQVIKTFLTSNNNGSSIPSLR